MTATDTTTTTLYYVTARDAFHTTNGTPGRDCLEMVDTTTSDRTPQERAADFREQGFNDVRVEPAVGLRCSIFRDSDLAGDFSNDGLSSRVTRVTLVGTEVYNATNGSLPSAPSDTAPAVELGETVPGHTVARPVSDAERGRGMFGGTFVWTSDSRFRAMHEGPIPLHDRHE